MKRMQSVQDKSEEVKSLHVVMWRVRSAQNIEERRLQSQSRCKVQSESSVDKGEESKVQ